MPGASRRSPSAESSPSSAKTSWFGRKRARYSCSLKPCVAEHFLFLRSESPQRRGGKDVWHDYAPRDTEAQVVRRLVLVVHHRHQRDPESCRDEGLRIGTVRESHVGALIPQQASEVMRSTSDSGCLSCQIRRAPPADDHDVRPTLQCQPHRLRVIPGCQEYVIPLLSELIHDLPKQSNMRRIAEVDPDPHVSSFQDTQSRRVDAATIRTSRRACVSAAGYPLPGPAKTSILALEASVNKRRPERPGKSFPYRRGIRTPEDRAQWTGATVGPCAARARETRLDCARFGSPSPRPPKSRCSNLIQKRRYLPRTPPAKAPGASTLFPNACTRSDSCKSS